MPFSSLPGLFQLSLSLSTPFMALYIFSWHSPPLRTIPWPSPILRGTVQTSLSLSNPPCPYPSSLALSTPHHLLLALTFLRCHCPPLHGPLHPSLALSTPHHHSLALSNPPWSCPNLPGAFQPSLANPRPSSWHSPFFPGSLQSSLVLFNHTWQFPTVYGNTGSGGTAKG